MPPQQPTDRELIDASNSQHSDYDSNNDDVDSMAAGDAPQQGNVPRPPPPNGANARIATNTAQLLQQLGPLFSSNQPGGSSGSRSPQSTLLAQTHSYIRHTLFVQFFYVYLLDRSLLLLSIRFMAYIILVFVKKNKQQATWFWTSLLVCMLLLHVLEVVLVPSWYFEWDGLLRSYGPAIFNWLKSNDNQYPLEFWTRRGLILFERVFCDVAIWAVGFLSVWVEWKKDSLEYLRGPPNRRGDMHDEHTNTDDATSDFTNTIDDEIHITINNDIIEGSTINPRGGNGTSMSSSSNVNQSTAGNGSSSPQQQNLIHRRRTSSNAQDLTELQDVSDRSNLLSFRQDQNENDDIFDEI